MRAFVRRGPLAAWAACVVLLAPVVLAQPAPTAPVTVRGPLRRTPPVPAPVVTPGPPAPSVTAPVATPPPVTPPPVTPPPVTAAPVTAAPVTAPPAPAVTAPAITAPVAVPTVPVGTGLAPAMVAPAADVLDAGVPVIVPTVDAGSNPAQTPTTTQDAGTPVGPAPPAADAAVTAPGTTEPTPGGTDTTATVATAPPALTPAQTRALAHYERGRQAYAAGRYRVAARELEEAYRNDRTGTNLLFNLGAVYERLGDVERAMAAYEGYLSFVDEPAEQARTQRILMRLRGARVELASLSRTRGRADALFWSTTGAALAGTAIGVSWLATRQNSDAIEPAVAVTAGGVALGVLATVLYLTREGPPRWPVPMMSAQAGGSLGLAGVF